MKLASLSGTAIDNLRKSAQKDDDTYAVTVNRLRGEERLSGPFRYTVSFSFTERSGDSSSDASNGQVSSQRSSSQGSTFSDVVGQPITLRFQRSMAGGARKRARTVTGIVTRIRQHGAGTPDANLTTTGYLVDIRPTLWRLSLSRTSRTFNDRPVVVDTSAGNASEGVLNTLLNHHGLSFETHLKDRYEPRAQVAQHDETDLDFFHRVAEEAGIVYYFTKDGHLMLVDHNGDSAYPSYQRFEQTHEGPSPVQTLEAGTRSQDRRKEGVLDTYSFEQNIIPAGLTAQSFDFDRGGVVSQSTERTSRSDTEEATGIVREPGVLSWHSRLSPEEAWSEGGRSPGMTRRRVEQLQAAHKILRGTTTARLLGVGMRFALDPATCGDVLAHLQPNDSTSSGPSPEFIVGRTLVRIEKGECQVEFEAFPKDDPTKDVSHNYRGNRHAARSTRASGSENTVDRTYALDVQATATPSGRPRRAASAPEHKSGVHLAEVMELPPAHSKEAKQGEVKVQIDGSEGDPIWARVLTHGSGSSYGRQFLPRPGTKVVVAYPRKDPNETLVVVGSLHHGTHPTPYSGHPGTRSGIRTRSARGMHTEMTLIDDAKGSSDTSGGSEEYRTIAPKYRTEVTGMEKNVGDGKVTYYVFSESNSLNLDRKDFEPSPPKYIKEKKDYPPKSDTECSLKPIVSNIVEEYGFDIGEETISVDDFSSKKDKTTFKIRDDAPKEVKESAEEQVTLEEFMFDLSDTKEVERKDFDDSGDNLLWYTLEDPNLAPESISYQRYSTLSSETTFIFNGSEGSGVSALAQKMNEKDEGDELTLILPGQDLYEVFVARSAFTLTADGLGKDAYDVPPFQELYSGTQEVEALKQGDKNRREFTQGGTIDACQGTYELHTYGDRLEIFRAPKSGSKDVMNQEFTEEWTVEDLPAQHAQFEDDNPVMVLNKDGSIVLQSSDGINIESAGDINIQSGGSINMYAEDDIEQEAEKEVSIVAPTIKLGKRGTTHKIEMTSDHHYKATSDIEIVNSSDVLKLIHENIVMKHTFMDFALNQLHWKNINVGFKTIEGFDGKGVLGIDSKTALFDNKNILIGEKNTLLRGKTELARMKEDLAATKERLAKNESDLVSTNETLADTKEKIVTGDNILDKYEEAVAYESISALYTAE